MTRPKNEDWPITRSRSVHFSTSEIAAITYGYHNQRPCRDVARELSCPIRTINAWYAKLREGWEPGQKPQTRPGSDACFVAPVVERPIPAPNALPWCIPKLRAGRA